MSHPIRNNDPDDPVTYSAGELPEGLSLNSDTGVISGTIDLRPARSSEEGSPGQDDDIKPDLLIDPPEEDPGSPPEPPGGRC